MLLAVACNNNKVDEKTTQSTVEKSDSIAGPDRPANDPAPGNTANKTDYSYDQPVTISGKISRETFFGAPGYGENPETDAKEERYLLVPDQPINVIGEPDPEDDSKESKYNVSKIQLIYDEKTIDIGKYLGSKVELTGTFFGAHTGHHHTPVLMDVTNLKAM